jgi:polysaccharide pyruvyl transferase CsaB
MKILLIGWFGAGNMGDEAILISELLFLKKQIADAEFHILSFDAGRTEKLTAHMPEVKKIIRFGAKHRVFRSEIFGLLRSLKEVDFVLIGGGGLFQDIYNFYPIPFFTLMTLLSRFYKKPVMLYCVGIGPINAPANKTLCRWAANAADLISVRDRDSADLLKKLGVNRSIPVSSDPVFLLESVSAEAIEHFLELNHLNDPSPLIGVCVQELLHWSDADRRTLAEVLDAAADKWSARTVFLPFGAYRDGWFRRASADSVDLAASKKLFSLMKCGAYIAPTGEWSPQELLAAMGRMSIVISMRLHGLIMAMNMGTPAIALTYAEESKLKNLMKAFDRQESIFEVTGLDKQKLLLALESLILEGNRVKQELRTKAASFRNVALDCNTSMIRSLVEREVR